MPKSIRAVFNWGMLTLILSLIGGYYISELSTRYGIYIGLVLVIYVFASVSYLREKIEMIKVEHEISVMVENKELKEFKNYSKKTKKS